MMYLPRRGTLPRPVHDPFLHLLTSVKAPWQQDSREGNRSEDADWAHSLARPWCRVFTESPAPATVNRFKEQYKRLLFAITDESFQETLDRFVAKNRKITALVRHGHKQIKGTTRRSGLKNLESVRNYAIATSRILGERAGFLCKCNTSHTAVFRMEDRMEQLSKCDNAADVLKQISFRLVFRNTGRCVVCKECRHWQWAVMNAKLICTESFKAPHVDEERGSKRQKKVTFRVSHLWKSQPPNSSESSPKPLVDLCLFISTLQESTIPTSPTSADLSTDDWELKILPFSPASSWSSLVSFHDLLLTSRAAGFPTEQRLRLALSVASSVLYLHGTDWLKAHWTSRDILFIQRHDGDVVYEPFVGQVFELRANKTASRAHLRWPQIMEPSIFALGLFLIELAYGQSWECLRQAVLPDNVIWENERLLVDLAAANAILAQANDEKALPQHRPFHREGPCYLEAVRNCISGDFGQSVTSLADDIFRDAVYQNIVCNLQDALDDLMKDTPYTGRSVTHQFIHVESTELRSDQASDTGSDGGSKRAPVDTAESTSLEFRLFDDHNARAEAYVCLTCKVFRRRSICLLRTDLRGAEG
jgi:hypothetical protein